MWWVMGRGMHFVLRQVTTEQLTFIGPVSVPGPVLEALDK